MPKNKEELKKLISNLQAVEFHKYYNVIGHRIRHLDKWLDIPEDRWKCTVVDEVFYQNGRWEPQFVGDERVPFHDERLPYRYRTNVHLVSSL